MSIPARVGRNDPCPCGSGKKYKKCHLDADEGPRRAVSAPSIIDMENRLVEEMLRFAESRYGFDWLGLDVDQEQPESLDLISPWYPWAAEFEGKRLADVYFERNEARLTPDEREWFTAQRMAYLSVWEVTAATAETTAVRDLLTGETGTVYGGLRAFTPGETVLARMLEYHGRSFVAGVHGRSLPRESVAEVVDGIRTELGGSETAVKAERVRDETNGWLLIHRWADAVYGDDEDEHLDAEEEPDVLKTLRVDMNDLEFAFESNDVFENYLDTQTGKVIAIPGDAYETFHGDEDRDEDEDDETAAALIEDDPKRFLRLESGADLRPSLDDAREFARSVEDAPFRQRLEAALDQRRGAFRGFLDVLHQELEERERWYHVSRQHVRDNIASRLAARGINIAYEPLPPFQPRNDVRRHLLAGAAAFVERAKRIEGVTRIALIGSLTTPKRSPNNVNFLVTVAAEDIVPDLAAAGRKLMGHCQQLNRGADIFLADPTGRYLGRTCPWRDCGPGIRQRCQAQNCGDHLYDDLHVLTLQRDTIAAPPLEIWPKAVVRGDVPTDVLEAFGTGK